MALGACDVDISYNYNKDADADFCLVSTNL